MLNGNTGAMLSKLASATGISDRQPGAVAEPAHRREQHDLAGDARCGRNPAAATDIAENQRDDPGQPASQALGTGGRQATYRPSPASKRRSGSRSNPNRATLTAALQAMLTYQTAQADREAYVRRLTTAQEQAGI